jgi:excisionase family DNA binding protein
MGSADELEATLTAADLAPVLRMSKKQVLELARRKVIPCMRAGRAVRFSPGEIKAWMKAGGKAFPGGWRREPV